LCDCKVRFFNDNTEKYRDVKKPLHGLSFLFLYTRIAGIIVDSFYFMFESDTSRRIKELEFQLINEEEKYVNAVRSHKDYNTLRTYRKNMYNMKTQLEQLYNSADDITNP
jgi:hypothetical protein